MNQSAWFGITPHDIVVIVLAIIITAIVTRGWRRLGLGFGKYWLARGQTAAYYASAPMSVLVPYVGKQVCFTILYATTLLALTLGLSRHHSPGVVGYIFSIIVGVLLFGMFETYIRLFEIQWTAAEAWERDKTSP